MGVAQTGVHALPPEGRHEVGGVTHEEDATLRKLRSDERMECVDRLAHDLEFGHGLSAVVPARHASSGASDQHAYGLALQQVLFALARQEHELPASLPARPRYAHRRAARIAEEDNGVGRLTIAFAINHQPPLACSDPARAIDCTQDRRAHGNIERTPYFALPAITSQQISALHRHQRSIGRANGDADPLIVLFERDHSMLEENSYAREALKPAQ